MYTFSPRRTPDEDLTIKTMFWSPPRSVSVRGAVRALFFVVMTGVATASCNLLEPEISDFGTVEFLEIEGGCWIIQTESEQFNPINMPAEFRVDGLEIQFEASGRIGGASFCPGQRIELSWIDYSDGG